MGCDAPAKKMFCLMAAGCFLLWASDEICFFSSRKVRRDWPGSWCHYSCLRNFPIPQAAKAEEQGKEGEPADGFSR